MRFKPAWFVEEVSHKEQVRHFHIVYCMLMDLWLFQQKKKDEFCFSFDANAVIGM